MIWWLLLPSCPTCPHLTCSGLCRRISTFQYDQKHLCPRLTTFGLVPALTRWLWGKKGGQFLLGSRLSSFCPANSQHLIGMSFKAVHQESSDRNTKSFHQLFEVRARHIPGSSTSINHSIVAHDIRTRSDRDSAGKCCISMCFSVLH